MVKIIGIAGGSGSGKSTLAYGLQDKFPNLVEVVHFDDYQKKKEEVPVEERMTNWDSPDAIDFDSLEKDLMSLKKGNSAEIMTKSERKNPQYKEKGRIPLKLESKPIIIVEGFLALYEERIRNIYDYSIFLDLDANERINRRTKFIYQEYLDKILIPMHNKFIEPTKKYADFVIDVSNYSSGGLQELILNKLKDRGIL